MIVGQAAFLAVFVSNKVTAEGWIIWWIPTFRGMFGAMSNVVLILVKTRKWKGKGTYTPRLWVCDLPHLVSRCGCFSHPGLWVMVYRSKRQRMAAILLASINNPPFLPQKSSEMPAPGTSCLRDGLGRGWVRGRRSYEDKRGWRGMWSFMRGQAADLGIGKRGLHWYFVQTTWTTLTLVKKGSMKRVEEQMRVQTMWMQNKNKTWGALDRHEEQIPRCLASSP